MIPPGSRAPQFDLQTQAGSRFRLADFHGKHNVLLMFLPAAFTPICTTELPALAALRDQFWMNANTAVAAVTVDNSPANREWARRCNSDGVIVLSDFYPHGAVSQAYGAWIPGEGISDRASVIIDRNGIVRYSESVGKFGKRSVPALLDFAQSIEGNRPAGRATAGMHLDLPVLYTSTTCPHCVAIKTLVQRLRLDDRIVIRDVDQDTDAMIQLLKVQSHGLVPTLARSDGKNLLVFTGEGPVASQLTALATKRVAA